jgi:hypothetical protein
MYKDDPNLEKPENEDVKIWRYMDLWKFIDMLTTSTLYFTRVDNLDDPNEGSWRPSGVYEAYKSYGDQYIKDLQYWEKVFRTTGAVNCWHVNDSESLKMWELYIPHGHGVAIQSTYGLLRNAIQPYDENICTIGMMQYIDYDKEKFKRCTQNSFGRFTDFFTYKNLDFRHENELRALIMAMGDRNNQAKSIPKGGIKLKVSLNDLIKTVYLSPNAQEWKLDLLKKLVSDYKVETEISHSLLR